MNSMMFRFSVLGCTGSIRLMTGHLVAIQSYLWWGDVGERPAGTWSGEESRPKGLEDPQGAGNGAGSLSE